MTTKKIVIIEDDPAINHGIELTLGKEQYDFCCCYNLREAKDIHNADLVILEQDLFDIPASEIHKVKVCETILDGKTVYKA